MFRRPFAILTITSILVACAEVPEVVDGAIPISDTSAVQSAAVINATNGESEALQEASDSAQILADVLAADAEVKAGWETQVGRMNPPIEASLVDVELGEIEATPAAKPESNFDHSPFNALLKKHVSPTGVVNYAGFKDNAAFQGYLDQLSTHPPRDNWPKKERMVYWINAYNAFTVKLIIDNMPLKSIKDVGSPWKKKFFKIDGKDFDLNTIEHEILRKQFNDPRIHFAINCASASCPKLLNATFELATLEAQLQQAAKTFINDPSKNLVAADELKLSKIFSWFKSDFADNNEELISYLNNYSRVQINDDAKLSFLDYDWSLNDK